MLKPIERMHKRSKMFRIGCTCMGSKLSACYRTLRDEETGLEFCMIAIVNEPGSTFYFLVHNNANYIKSCYGDKAYDDAEYETVKLPQEVLESDIYKQVCQQLLNGLDTLIYGDVDYEKYLGMQGYEMLKL